VVDTKKRYDCFRGTDLDTTLRTHGIDTVLITGINTNSCVLATVCAANSRDYAVMVVEDCVNTMDSPAHHDAALRCIRTAFGFVASSAEVLELARSWAAGDA
jgi:nicotinamidase-related amidase